MFDSGTLGSQNALLLLRWLVTFGTTVSSRTSRTLRHHLRALSCRSRDIGVPLRGGSIVLTSRAFRRFSLGRWALACATLVFDRFSLARGEIYRCNPVFLGRRFGSVFMVGSTRISFLTSLFVDSFFTLPLVSSSWIPRFNALGRRGRFLIFPVFWLGRRRFHFRFFGRNLFSHGLLIDLGLCGRRGLLALSRGIDWSRFFFTFPFFWFRTLKTIGQTCIDQYVSPTYTRQTALPSPFELIHSSS